MDASGKITVDSPAYRTGLDLYKKLYDPARRRRIRCRRNSPRPTPPSIGAGATMLQWNAAFGDLDNKDKTPAVAGKIGTVARRRARRPLHPHPRPRLRAEQGLGQQGSGAEIPRLAGKSRRDHRLSKAGGSPAVSDAITTKLPDRPDLVKLGAFPASTVT